MGRLVDCAIQDINNLDVPMRTLRTRFSNGPRLNLNLCQKQFPASEKDFSHENYYTGIMRNEYNCSSYWILNNDDASLKYGVDEQNV